MKRAFILLFLIGFFLQNAIAQFPYFESFKNSSAPGFIFGGTPLAYLTAKVIDSEGSGYLRLTNGDTWQNGFAYSNRVFPSSDGLNISFEYYTHGGTGADGICFFLFDASANPVKVGAFGGALGYAQRDVPSTPGLTKGYLGIGIDEFGNFASSTEGRQVLNGRVPQAVTLRGAGDGAALVSTNYPFLTYRQTTSLPNGNDFTINGGNRNATDPAIEGFRKIFITLTPLPAGGFNVKIRMQHRTNNLTRIIDLINYDYTTPAPANFKMGFAAASGGMTNFHEIRNLSVTLINSDPVINAPALTTSEDTPVNGSVSATDVDGDPVTFVKFTDPAHGTVQFNSNGTYTYTPKPNYHGSDNFEVTASDGRGGFSRATVNITIAPGPDPLPIVGLAKTVSEPKLQVNGSYTFTYTITASNLGPVPITSLEVTDDLAQVFSEPAVFEVQGNIKVSGNLKANQSFTGKGNNNLLESESSLSVGESAIIEFTVNVLPNKNFGSFYNSATAKATSDAGEISTDVSTTGTDPDPNNNGFPSENEPTVVALKPTTLYIPEGFSPNDDGVNDKFIIENGGGDRISLEVFNRWGNQVYKNTDYKNDWDGVANQGIRIGEILPEGTYYIVILINGQNRLTNFITIKR